VGFSAANPPEPAWRAIPAQVATTPTTADLVALHGGRERLLRIADVAERLAVCAATVYRLCERWELPHIRIVNSIGIRPRDLEALLAKRSGAE
jgi:predicted DNA-binding transcriptional regulator AlpA